MRQEPNIRIKFTYNNEVMMKQIVFTLSVKVESVEICNVYKDHTGKPPLKP